METLASSFYQMIRPFAELFRADVGPTFLSVTLAWVTTPCPGRMSDLLRILGNQTQKHPSTYYRLFSKSKWFHDLLAVGLLRLLIPLLQDNTLRIAIDDTLLKHRGPKIWGASIFRDAVLSTRKHVVTRWGLNWVVLSAAVPNPLRPGTFLSIPLFLRLFLTKAWCQKLELEYQAPTQLANELMGLLLAATPESINIRLVTDAGYTNKQLALWSDQNVHFTGRIRSDACLQYPVWTREYKGRGRHPSYGEAAPKPRSMVKDRRRKRKRVVFTSYQGVEHEVEVVEFIGTYAKVFGTQLMRFLFFQEPGKEAVYLVSTDLESELSVILEDLVSRWSIEVCFREVKQWMGVERSQVRSEKAVLRMAPFGFWLVGVVKVWFLQHAKELPDVRVETSWYQPKTISFAKMLGTLRYVILMTLLDDSCENNELLDCFGLPEEMQKKKSLLLRVFCGC